MYVATSFLCRFLWHIILRFLYAMIKAFRYREDSYQRFEVPVKHKNKLIMKLESDILPKEIAAAIKEVYVLLKIFCLLRLYSHIAGARKFDNVINVFCGDLIALD